MRLIVATLILFGLVGCATHPRNMPQDLIVFVVRHAEKESAPASDPPLTIAGQARAKKLALQLGPEPLNAAYATRYQRTQQTAMPAAQANAIPVTPYDASFPPVIFAAQLRQAHPTGRILVVGHSNTVPGIVAALCSCAVDPLSDNDYDRLYEIRIDAAGRATLMQRIY